MRRSAFLAGSAALAVPAIARAAASTVRVGILNIIPDAPYLIADKKGFFKDEGLAVAFTAFASAGNMVVPMSTGQLDAGGGAPAAGIYNGAARGVRVRVVADKGRDARGYGFNPLLVRKELVTSGKFKSPRDLKGMTVGSNQPGSVSASALYELLKKYGLALSDVHVQNLDYPDHVAALANGKLDASITAEPEATEAERAGTAVRIMGNDAWYPDQQLSVVIYAGDFASRRSEAGAFMRAYVRAARFYYEALRDGHFGGPNADEVIGILVAATKLKDPAIYRAIHPSSLDPDGRLNLASMRKDLAFFRQQGIVTANVGVEAVVDESFVRDAIATLGPYKGKRSS